MGVKIFEVKCKHSKMYTEGAPRLAEEPLLLYARLYLRGRGWGDYLLLTPSFLAMSSGRALRLMIMFIVFPLTKL